MRIKSPGEVRVFWWVTLLYIALHFATKYW